MQLHVGAFISEQNSLMYFGGLVDESGSGDRVGLGVTKCRKCGCLHQVETS